MVPWGNLIAAVQDMKGAYKMKKDVLPGPVLTEQGVMVLNLNRVDSSDGIK